MSEVRYYFINWFIMLSILIFYQISIKKNISIVWKNKEFQLRIARRNCEINAEDLQHGRCTGELPS